MKTPLPLSRFQSWFQRIPLLRSPLGILSVFGVLLIGILIFQALTGPQATRVVPPPALSSPTGSEGSIRLEGQADWPAIPETVPTYQISAYTELQQGVNTWAGQEGLQPFGSSGRTFTNASRTQVITVSPGGQAVTYRNSDLTFQSVVDESVAERQLELFLERLGFSFDEFTVRKDYVAPEQTNPDDFITTSNPNEAVAVRFFLTPSLNSFPLRWEAGSVEEFVFVVTNQGVTTATLPHFPIVRQESGELRTFSQERVRENIQSGGYVIIGTVGAGADRGTLISLQAERITIEYRASTNTNTIKPFVRIQGSGTYSDGQTFPTQIVAPITQ